MKVGIALALLFLLDIATKWFALDSLAPMQWGSAYPYGGIPLFDWGITCSLNREFNTGAAWGFFPGHPGLLFAVRTLIIAFLVGYLILRKEKSFALWLIVVGAIGNAIDYCVYGHVIDFVHVTFWGKSFPIFNCADAYITLGALFMLFNPKELMLRISDPHSEGIYQASKWLKVPVLCDASELASLVDGSFAIVPMTGLFDGKPIPAAEFVNVFAEWIEGLKAGKIPTDQDLRRILACAWTEDLDALWLQPVAGKGYLTKIARPVVQVQAHFFSYSRVDGAFRSMSMGQESIFWGLQCSFPQVFQDPKTMEIRAAQKNGLFEKIRRWSREKTRATPFVVDGKKENVPIRLGQNCFSWIGKHPQLIEQRIQVVQ